MKQVIITFILFCLIPVTSFAGVMEEVKVIAVKLVVKQDWQTYFTVGYLDGGVLMDTAGIGAGGGGLTAPNETAEDDSEENIKTYRR